MTLISSRGTFSISMLRITEDRLSSLSVWSQLSGGSTVSSISLISRSLFCWSSHRMHSLMSYSICRFLVFLRSPYFSRQRSMVQVQLETSSLSSSFSRPALQSLASSSCACWSSWASCFLSPSRALSRWQRVISTWSFFSRRYWFSSWTCRLVSFMFWIVFSIPSSCPSSAFIFFSFSAVSFFRMATSRLLCYNSLPLDSVGLALAAFSSRSAFLRLSSASCCRTVSTSARCSTSFALLAPFSSNRLKFSAWFIFSKDLFMFDDVFLWGISTGLFSRVFMRRSEVEKVSEATLDLSPISLLGEVRLLGWAGALAGILFSLEDRDSDSLEAWPGLSFFYGALALFREMTMSILSLEVPMSFSRRTWVLPSLRSSSVWKPPTQLMISAPSYDTSQILMMPLMGQNLARVPEQSTSTYSQSGVPICRHLAVLLPSLISSTFSQWVLSLEVDWISRGVITNRYLHVIWGSSYYRLISIIHSGIRRPILHNNRQRSGYGCEPGSGLVYEAEAGMYWSSSLLNSYTLGSQALSRCRFDPYCSRCCYISCSLLCRALSFYLYSSSSLLAFYQYCLQSSFFAFSSIQRCSSLYFSSCLWSTLAAGGFSLSLSHSSTSQKSIRSCCCFCATACCCGTNPACCWA